jgi:hypothetical protein
LIDALKITGGKFARAATMASALMACSTPPQGVPGGSATASQNVPSSEQCSMLAVMACNAMALLSSDSKPTCSAYRAPGGRRIESCGTAPISATAVQPASVNTQFYPVQLAWSDNSDNESNFVIERCDQVSVAPTEQKNAACVGAWRQIATVGANTTSYVDSTAAFNQSYIYRVKALNSKGSSDYTAEAVITTPSR